MQIPDLSPSARSQSYISLLRDLLLLGLVVATFAAFAPNQQANAAEEQRRMKIVFEVTSGTHAFGAFVSNVEGVQKNSGGIADITVVAYGNGVKLLRAPDNAHEKRLAKLADGGVDFIVCKESLEEAGMDTSELLGFARTVRSGEQEIEKLEEQGWARVSDGDSYVSDL